MNIQHKAVRLGGFKVLDEAEGIVETFVSVTGIVDEVKDRILPGAYEKTLKVRTPKGVWAHNWEATVSKTLAVEELPPGHADLPAEQPNGEPWPADAGALRVRTKFNLKTTRGKDAFEDVLFFGPDQEWSIGYDVPRGKSKVNQQTGVRDIYEIDLYEYSPVLWGAMPLARTVGSVKDAQQQWREAVEGGAPRVVEGEPHPDVEVAETKEADEPTEVKDAGEPAETKGAGDEGQPEAEEPKLGATQHDGFVVLQREGKAVVAFEGRDEEVGAWDDEDAARTAVKILTVGAPAGKSLVDAVKAAAEKGVAPVAAPVDPEWLIDGVTLDRKAFGDACRDATLAAAGEKAYIALTGSYEERQRALRMAVNGELGNEDYWPWSDGPDRFGPSVYAGLEATFDDRAVVEVYDYDGRSERLTFWEIPYTWSEGDGVTLGTPREVRLVANAEAKSRRPSEDVVEQARSAMFLALKALADGSEAAAQPPPVETGDEPPPAGQEAPIDKAPNSTQTNLKIETPANPGDEEKALLTLDELAEARQFVGLSA